MIQKEQMKPEAEQAGGKDPKEMADFSALQAEFTEEDRALAEAGMSDYAAGLAAEDAGQWQKI